MSFIQRIKLCLERLKNDDLNDLNDLNDEINYDIKKLIIYKNHQTEFKNYKECVICLEDMKNDEELILISCSHIYHKECIQKWFQKNNICPLCDFIV